MFHAKLLEQETDVSQISSQKGFKNQKHSRLSYNRHANNDSGSPNQVQGRDQGESVQQNLIRNCKYCGGSHKRGSCPAYGKLCRRCNKKGHFASVCLSKSINFVEKEVVNYDETYNEDDFSFEIGTIFADDQEIEIDGNRESEDFMGTFMGNIS